MATRLNQNQLDKLRNLFYNESGMPRKPEMWDYEPDFSDGIIGDQYQLKKGPDLGSTIDVVVTATVHQKGSNCGIKHVISRGGYDITEEVVFGQLDAKEIYANLETARVNEEKRKENYERDTLVQMTATWLDRLK